MPPYPIGKGATARQVNPKGFDPESFSIAFVNPFVSCGSSTGGPWRLLTEMAQRKIPARNK